MRVLLIHSSSVNKQAAVNEQRVCSFSSHAVFSFTILPSCHSCKHLIQLEKHSCGEKSSPALFLIVNKMKSDEFN